MARLFTPKNTPENSVAIAEEAACERYSGPDAMRTVQYYARLLLVTGRCLSGRSLNKGDRVLVQGSLVTTEASLGPPR